LTALHGVLKATPVTKLATNLENIRVVATIRAGEIPLEKQYSWYKKFAADYHLEIPPDVQAAGEAPAEGPAKEAPRPKRTAATLTPPKLPGGSKVDVKEEKETGLEHMPVVGEKISGATKSTWGACTVTGLYKNFAVTDELPRTNTKQQNMCLRTGMQFCVQMKGEPKPVEYRVECVGLIYGLSTSATKARAAVLTRRTQGQQKWGKLETYDASHMPDHGFYQVDAHTHTDAQSRSRRHTYRRTNTGNARANMQARTRVRTHR
jgi:hypothetical protein